MMQKKLFWLVTIYFLMQISASAYNDPILFRRVSPQGGFTYGAIRTITQDSLGNIWFGTEHGLYRYNSREIHKYISNPGDNHSLENDNIRKIITTKSGKLWIVTYEGLCNFDYKTHYFVHVPLKVEPQGIDLSAVQSMTESKSGDLFAVFYRHIGLFRKGSNDSIDILPFKFKPDESISAVTLDKLNQLWIGTNQGSLYKSCPPYKSVSFFCKHRTEAILTLCADNNTMWIGYDWGGADHVSENGTIVKHYDSNQSGDNYIPHERVRTIIKDAFNQIWIATFKGLLLVSKKGNQVIRSDHYNRLPNNSIYSLFPDAQNGMWIGTWSGGLVYYNPNENRFLHVQRISNRNEGGGDVVSSFAEDHNGKIWIGTENDGLGSYDPKTGRLEQYDLPREVIGNSNIKSLAVDDQNRIWVGFFSKGLWLFDPKRKTFEQKKILKSLRVHIYGIWPTKEGLWLASFSHGLIYYGFKTGKIILYHNESSNPHSLSSNTARCVLIDKYGGIWVGTNFGLNYLSKGSRKFQRYFADPEKNSISNNEIFSLYEDHEGKIWIGMGRRGVDCYNPDDEKFTNYTKAEGLAGDNVYGILEDNQQNMWFSSEMGISRYSAVNHSFRNFHEDEGLQGNQFNPGAAFKTSEGLLLFGGPNGFNLINPGKIATNLFQPTARISRMFINGKLLAAYKDRKFNSINTLSSIKLKYKQSSLSFEFVSDNFILSQRNMFKYRLVNYSDQWSEANTKGAATFTKIPPGDYVLEVMAYNNDGISNTAIRRLNIKITPPIWGTWYAYLFYLIVTTGTLIFIRNGVVTRQKLKNELLIERVKSEKEEELHQSKMQFFTNISHEFKTPLTLILSPLEQIVGKKRFDPDTEDHLQMIQRNAQRLRRLISQVIDFRKFELGKSSFHARQTDLVKLSMEICDFYKLYAKDMSIRFNFQADALSIIAMIDKEKIDKVIFNFLSNAFKNTPEGGEISISIKQHSSLSQLFKTGYLTNRSIDVDGSGIEICVKDSGSGIDGNEIPLIFERFYQRSGPLSQGTGIGLHLCREYAQLHQGTIYVESELGKGTRFSIVLPTDTLKEHKGDDQVQQSWGTNESLDTKSEKLSLKENTILIVEDHLEMQRYLRTIFQNKFHILTASNGNQGFDIGTEFVPDLIISDVMMPGMDGFELCGRFKADIRTSHIPVILLTALSETDKHINGLQTGADAYLTKPFEDSLLKAQVRNLLKSRKALQESFVKSQEEWEGDENLMPADKNLVNKAIRIIERHLQEANFSVEFLAGELNISRSSLHRKIRALTNQSSSEFIRYVRLKKAIQLMKDSNYNIDEIGYDVGFNSHSYFTQSFKRQYGETPSTYMNNLKKQTT